MPGAPTGDWYFVEIKRHYNPGNYYEVQTAHAMTGPVGTIYERGQQSGSAGSGWGTWTKQGASIVHGGAYYYRYTDGACMGGNPVTGNCSCPSGTSPYTTITAVGTYMGALTGVVCN